MTKEEIKDHKLAIDAMSQCEMARLWRHAPTGHIYFRSDLPLSKYFNKRFKELGGMTVAISKDLGWG